MPSTSKRLRWFYLSVVAEATSDKPSRFLGGAVVQAVNEPGAIKRCMELKIPTDGEILVWDIDKDINRVPADMRNRSLTKQEIFERLEGKRIGE